MFRSLPVVALAALTLSACQGAQQAAAPKTAGTSALVESCKEAELTMPDEFVVARIEGADVTRKDLGEELVEVEQTALREYCQQVYTARQMALENKVREKLVEKAAAKKQQTTEEYLQAELEAKVGEPSDEEIQAFYKERAPPDAPPVDMVKPQIAQALKREKMAEAVEGLFAELEKGVAVERHLPDVRPAAVDVGVAAHTPTAGADKPVVEVIEFADFECPYCQVMATALDDVREQFKDKPVRFSYRHFPLSFHPNARPAAEVSQCAREQGKFWEVHDKIYANMDKMDKESLKAHASEAGVDVATLESCLASERPGKEVEADLAEGKQAGVEGTPTLYINGRAFQGRPTPEAISAAIAAELGSAS